MKFKIPFAAVLVLVVLVITVVPSILIWTVFASVMNSSLQLLEDTTATSLQTLQATTSSSIGRLQNATTESLGMLEGTTTHSMKAISHKLQRNYLEKALSTLNVRIAEGDNEMAAQVYYLKMIAADQMDHRPHATSLADLQATTDIRKRNLITMKAHQYFSFVMQSAMYLPNGPADWGTRTWWMVWQALNFDLTTQMYQRTVYYSQIALNAEQTQTNMQIWYPSQSSGDNLIPMQDVTVPAAAFAVKLAGLGWATDSSFSEYSGQVEVNLRQYFEAANNTWLEVILSLNTQTISAELRSLLADGSPKDRSFMFFRQPHGHMIAASHGKYHSESDRDLSTINPLVNPPKISEWSRMNCSNSTDVLIAEACQELYRLHGSWDRIPATDTEMILNGSRFWVDVGHSSSSLNFTVVMLKDRASVMGAIEAGQAAVMQQINEGNKEVNAEISASRTKVQEDIADSNVKVNQEVSAKKTLTYVILSIATVLGVSAPLVIGMWLGIKLVRLAGRMDDIATLNFHNESIRSTNFAEIDKFQKSFMQMSNGLKAFGKFVPGAVVKVLVSGSMSASDEMVSRELTVLFADIESFSTISETISPQDLVEVCTPYFEKMCRQIVKRNGTIDKFIGDCIMAMWNAPLEVDGHELDAIESGLAMQDAIQAAHAEWAAVGLPILKFRAGIHSGPCLVGNFGCSHRVAYTCLGDTVNLASRLEALNKKFGTYLMCSDNTYQKAKNRFHFRMLSKVTVPGKSEILPIYEVLAPIRGLAALKRPTWQNIKSPVDSPSSSPVARDRMYKSISMRTSSRPDISTAMVVQEADPLPGTWDDDTVETVYHWQWVTQARLLAHADLYESAYQALQSGKLALAKEKLALTTEFTPVDAAWAALAAQYEKQASGTLPQWDGVFYFEHKED